MKYAKLICLLFITVCLTFSCKKENSSMRNKNKPLIFYNRQPLNSADGTIDIDTLSWNNKTYYVGTDAQKGGEAQGRQILDFLNNSDISKIDRNNDGIIGYVLCIGDETHIDSNARTEGIRRALGTWNGSSKSNIKKKGSINIGGKSYKTVELASKVMIGENGSPWNAQAAKDAMKLWANSFDKSIDLVISTNDSMALACLSAENFPKGVPVFGFDANAPALDAINDDLLAGTITQNVDAQAQALLFLVRNACDGFRDSEVYQQGFSHSDQYGNRIATPFIFDETTRSMLVSNTPVTKDNLERFQNSRRDKHIKKINAPKIKLLLTVFNSNDAYLTQSYVPALNYYAPLLNIDLTIIYGDGQTEESCLSKFSNLDHYDAYAVNLVKTGNANLYTEKLK